jgi:hypothetical protein
MSVRTLCALALLATSSLSAQDTSAATRASTTCDATTGSDLRGECPRGRCARRARRTRRRRGIAASQDRDDVARWLLERRIDVAEAAHHRASHRPRRERGHLGAQRRRRHRALMAALVGRGVCIGSGGRVWPWSSTGRARSESPSGRRMRVAVEWVDRREAEKRQLSCTGGARAPVISMRVVSSRPARR